VKRSVDAILRPETATYLDTLLPKRDPLLARMEARAAERGYPISDPEVAEFLGITVRSTSPRLIVELGTNIGYGAVVLARAAGPGARVLTVEYREDLCEEARGFVADAGLAQQVEVRQGKALEVLAKIEEPIDFVYIDCVKEEYPEYLRLAAPKLSERGVLIADNVMWRGLVAASTVPEGERLRVDALREFNRLLTTTPGLRGMVLPFGDGVGYAVKTGG
jgi:predicted O-methyltransferase YrrM